MESIESSVKFIPYTQEAVYTKLSDLTNLKNLLEALPQGELQEKGMDIDLSKATVSTDFITIPILNMSLSLRIVEREPLKIIKFELAGIPVDASLWIQLLPEGSMESKMKVTVHYDIPFYLKPMLNGKLKDLPGGIDRLADMLSKIPY
jgi:hypothetical protein